MAEVNILRKVSALHAMMGRSQTRFAGVIQPAFEAAVLLVYLCIHHDFSEESKTNRFNTARRDLLDADMAHLNREDCIQAIQDALGHLQMLAEVSTMAETGAQTLSQIAGKVLPEGARKNGNAAIPHEAHVPEYFDFDSLPGIGTAPSFDMGDLNWTGVMNWRMLNPGL